MATRFEKSIENAQQRRLLEQELLAFGATELIATLLKQEGVNRSELAKRVGKSKAYVTQALAGSRNMTLHTFADLAFALGYRVELEAAPLHEGQGEFTVFDGGWLSNSKAACRQAKMGCGEFNENAGSGELAHAA